MERLDSQMYVRCSTNDRRLVKELSEKLFVTQSSIARVALKKGLALVGEHGISLDENQDSTKRSFV